MRITLPSGTPAELAHPTGGLSTAGLVIAADIGGLRPLFDRMAQQLADQLGWAVCVPEPFPGREELTLEERLAAMSGFVDDVVLGDLTSAADATEADPVSIIGFCMGGMYAMKASATGRFRRAVSFYGMIRVPEQWRSAGQSEPLDAVKAPGSCPILALTGTDDIWTPADDVDALEAAGAEVVRYAGAEHGFVHDPDRPAHRADYAADAWRRATAFLKDE